MSTILARVIGGGSSAGTATARDVLAGKTFSNDDDIEIVGTATAIPATEHHVTTEDQVIIGPYSHTTGNQTLKGISTQNISASNIKSGVTAKINNGESDIVSATGTYTSVLSSGQTAMTAAQLLAGYSGFVNGSGEIQGLMVDKSGSSTTATVSRDENTGDILTQIPTNGYYNTSAYLKASGNVFGDAAQTDVLSGKYFTSSNGLKIQGSIGVQAGKTVYATTSDQTAVSSGKYCSGDIIVKKLTQTNLTAANILRGKTISINNGSTNVWSVAGNSAVMKMISGTVNPNSAGNGSSLQTIEKGISSYKTFYPINISRSVTPLYSVMFNKTRGSNMCSISICNYSTRRVYARHTVYKSGYSSLTNNKFIQGILPSNFFSSSYITLPRPQYLSDTGNTMTYYVFGY